VTPQPVPLARSQVRTAVAALVRAFDDSPIMRFLFPEDWVRRRGLRQFFRAVVLDALPFGEVRAVVDGDGVPATAVWLPPGAHPPSTVRQLRQLVTTPLLGPLKPGSLLRSLRYLREVERFHPHEPHWYLALLGTDPPRQGQGLGRALLEPVLDRCDAEGLPAYLETDKERNLAYYARFGFELVDTLTPVPGGPPTWTMLRAPR
jgi:GNAT superfamily N-acetyltransferase